MKEILLSVKPEHLVKILNGEKTDEIRKTMPKCKLPCRVWLYCSKGKNLVLDDDDKKYYYNPECYNQNDTILNGKVVGCFILNKVRCFEADPSIYESNSIYETVGVVYKYIGELQNPTLELLNESCLTSKQLEEYLQEKNGDIIDKKFYGWCISDLKILDKPFDFWNDGYLGNPKTGLRILKAPQSWCYCEYDEVGFLPF